MAIVVVSTLMGVAWIPLYELSIEEYVGKSNVLWGTLLYALSPYLFLFTTVAYSEGIFLLGTLGAWYYFKKRKAFPAIAFASLAAVSRPTGLLILLPMLIEMLHTHRDAGVSIKRGLLYLGVPLAAFFSWLLYCRIMTSDWLAPFDRTAWDSWVALFVVIFKVIPSGGLPALVQNLNMSFTLYQFPVILFLPLSVVLIRSLSRVDRELAIYSAVYFAGIVTFGSLASLPRFVSFLYPVWIPAVRSLSGSRHPVLLTVAACVSLYLASLFLWGAFLNGQFIA